MANASFLDHLVYALGDEPRSLEETATAGRTDSTAEALAGAGFSQHWVCRPETTAYDLAHRAVDGIADRLDGVGAIVYATCIPANASIGDEARFRDPYAYLEWPERLDPDQWHFSPELLSLYGTAAYEGLTETEKKRLSSYETVNFFSLNIHGERPLVAGLSQRLYQSDTSEITPYLQHFLDEENKHMVYFRGFCMRYAPGEEEFLFFAKVLIFEEIVDVYNVRMSRDERLPAIVRRINLVHHVEESRHLAFGRGLVKELFDRHSPAWPAETLEGVRDYLRSYLVATWKEYYNPDAYRDAGLADPLGVYEAAFNDPHCHGHREEVSRKCLRYLQQNGILEEVSL